ncbi:putative EF-hand domain-containing protein [Helianthus annuus]|uniref:Parvalbumin, EF-hand domain pair n=1 Tax=Helianthus annuus TaxID=4232 RepID=A0A9K3NAD8_HELAN|nr:putative parvalbumin, EF-hand domain pair [Helianthus annuus]KAJ0527302.1 putative EF-hand domain-containing protein [Helianthus annuus]KAJ0535977.1 putative EF-hand domain-containing protein [Helianthus annuus]KAJ0543704.1 putative EF-hand domain-containing protein [Helianthus annuus]KAJ0708759.1 putative EF-hand domain-containing protein [Helianthus annuus]
MRKGWSGRRIEGTLPDNQMNGIFRALDTNGDGKLSRKELKVGLKSFGLRFAGVRAKRAIRHVDANGDGMISEDEIDELTKYASKWRI